MLAIDTVRKISNKLTEEDKLLHIKYSAAILVVSSLFLAILPALMLTFLIGLGKECWDHFYGSGFCLYDMLANMVGIGCSLLLITLAQFVLSFIG